MINKKLNCKNGKKMLIFLLTTLCISIISAKGLYYEITLNNNLEIKEIRVDFFNKEPININSPESLSNKLILVGLDQNEKIGIEFSTLDKIYFHGEVNESGDITDIGVGNSSDYSFKLYAPYNENIKEIVIQDNNKNEITRKDISEYSKDKIDKSIKSKGNYNKSSEEKNKSYLLWIIGIGIIVFICLIIWILGRNVKFK